MANFVYDHAKLLLATGALNLSTADCRLALLMTNTTADTEKDKGTISGYTLLDDYDGSGYPAGGIAFTGETVTEDNSGHKAILDANDITFNAIGAGTRQAQGALLYAFVSSLGASIPIAWFDTGGFPFAGNGSNVTFQVNAAGLLNLT